MREYAPLTLGQLGGQSGPRPPAARRAAVARDMPRDPREPLEALVDETLDLCRRFRAVAEQVHGRDAPSARRRDLLRELERQGPQTVPQMARASSVTRQHIQALVNPLAGAGYVEFVENPAHKRSALVRLTLRGEEAVEAVNRREARLRARLDLAATERELRHAAAVLRAVRDALEAV